MSRLYPALVVCALITFAASVAGGFGSSLRSLLNLVAAELFLPLIAGKGQLDPSYWSIVFELRCYAVVLLLICIETLRHLSIVLTIIAIAGIILNVLPSTQAVAGYLMFPHLSYFALGVLLHRMRVRGMDLFGVALTVIHLASAAYGSYLNFENVDMMDGVRSPWWIDLSIDLPYYASVVACLFVRLDS